MNMLMFSNPDKTFPIDTDTGHTPIADSSYTSFAFKEAPQTNKSNFTRVYILELDKIKSLEGIKFILETEINEIIASVGIVKMKLLKN